MTIHVQASEIGGLAQQTEQGSNQINDLMLALSGAYSSSEGYWQGNAHRQFVIAYGEWNTACGQMREALFEMQSLMRQWTDKVVELDNAVSTGGGGGGGGGGHMMV